MAKAATHGDQNAVLHFLAAASGALTLDAICIGVTGKACAPRSKERRGVIYALGCLMSKRYADRAAIVRSGGFADGSRTVSYEPTAAGRAFVKAGRTITSGPNGPHTGVRKRPAGKMRQTIWDALIVLERASLPDLVEAAIPDNSQLTKREREAAAVKVTDNARHYLNGLARAGIVKRLARRDPGSSPSSNGHLRFVLLRKLGPQAPVVGKTFVTDPNADGSDAKRIPYQVEKLPAASKRKPCA